MGTNDGSFHMATTPPLWENLHRGEIFIMLHVMGPSSWAFFWAYLLLFSEIGKTARYTTLLNLDVYY
jgi:hypothetical protein